MSFVTTKPAATMELSPMVTPCKMVELELTGGNVLNEGATGFPNRCERSSRNSSCVWYEPFKSKVMRRASSLILSMKPHMSTVSSGFHCFTCSKKFQVS